MKRWFARAAVAGFVLAALVAAAGAPAGAACMKQGELAVALAQLVGLAGPGVSPEAGAAALTAKGVRPIAGWNLEACLDETTIAELDRALKAAIASGAIDQQYESAVSDAYAIAAPAGPGAGPGGVGAGVPDAGKSRNPPVSPHQP